jgi:hypothetical protein
MKPDLLEGVMVIKRKMERRFRLDSNTQLRKRDRRADQPSQERRRGGLGSSVWLKDR